MTKAEILIIDDEPQMRRLLIINLEGEQYRTSWADTGRAGLALAAQHPPDLILLDIGLPDMSGHEVLRELRSRYTKPIIMLSVMSDEAAIVSALDHGATDYLTKPFRTGELLARVRSALRLSTPRETKSVWTFGPLEIDPNARTVRKNGIHLKLTATEYNLLLLFARHAGKVLTHQYILKEIWGHSHVDDSQYLRVFAGALRKKIEDDPHRPLLLVTESGVGYRFG